MRLWITSAYGYKVEKDELPRPGGLPYLDVPMNSVGVLHDTESSDLDATINYLRGQGFAPTFMVGEHRIVQTRPIGAQASTLHDGGSNPTNEVASVQIEAVGFAKTTPWQFDDATFLPLAALMARLADADVHVPLQKPDIRWKDDGSDLEPQANGVVWATDNTRRRQAVSEKLWPARHGWWMHLEVPYQDPTWHWDCGAVGRGALLDAAQALRSNTGGGEDKLLDPNYTKGYGEAWDALVAGTYDTHHYLDRNIGATKDTDSDEHNRARYIGRRDACKDFAWVSSLAAASGTPTP